MNDDERQLLEKHIELVLRSTLLIADWLDGKPINWEILRSDAQDEDK